MLLYIKGIENCGETIKRIAIVCKFPIGKRILAPERYLYETAELFSKMGMKVEFFVISGRTATSRINNKYKQNEFGITKISEYGFSLGRVFDLLCLMIFGFRPTYEIANRRISLLKALDYYDPNYVIVWDFGLSKLIEKYRFGRYGKPGIIFLGDSERIIYSNLDSVINIFGGAGVFASWVKRMLKGNYIKYNLNYYKRQIKIADALVVPSVEAANHLSARHNMLKGKVYSISPQYIRKISKRRFKISYRITNVLFLGSLPFRPNAEAIDIIYKDIAPKLPDKTFIIVGRGVPKKTEGNVKFVGEVADINKEIEGADICIAPMKSTSGRKTKVFDYFANGKAVLGTSIAFQGYNVRCGLNAIVEDNTRDFASKIKWLERNRRTFIRIQKNAFGVVREFEETNVAIKWKNLLNSITK